MVVVIIPDIRISSSLVYTKPTEEILLFREGAREVVRGRSIDLMNVFDVIVQIQD